MFVRGRVGDTMRQTHSTTVCHSRARSYVAVYIIWPVDNQVEPARVNRLNIQQTMPIRTATDGAPY